MSAVNNAELEALLGKFANAWGEGDVDAMMALMTDNCVYAASVGPEPGTRYVGQMQVRAGISRMLERDQTERSEVSNLFIVGDRAVCEWRYFRRDDNGQEIVTHGCDLFKFDGGKIAIKEAFRKIKED